MIEHSYVAINDELTQHVTDVGTGDTALVLVPGWTMTAASFEHQLVGLSQLTGLRVISYDPRAQGQSTMTPEGHHYEQHGRDLKALLGLLDVHRFVLAGWSAGGGDVMEYVRLFGTEGLVGFVLIGITPRAMGSGSTDWFWYDVSTILDSENEFRSNLLDLMSDRPSYTRGFIEWMLSDPSPEAVEFVTAMTNCTPTTTAVALNATYLFLDNTDDVRLLEGKVPLLYVTREEAGPAAAAWAELNTPSATVESFGRHMMFWEDPERFNQVMTRFLNPILGS